jgi:outer membrane murein-binding lipoprotein Lpp
MYDAFDIFQQGLLEEASKAASNAKRDAEHANDRIHTEVQRLNAKIDMLALICEALWETIQEHTAVTEAEIHEKIAEIDLRDGRRDGRITGRPTNCTQCGRAAHTRLVTCMYCGASLRSAP